MPLLRLASSFVGLAVLALGAGGPSPLQAATAANPTGVPLKLMVVFEGTGPTASPEVAEGATAAAKAIDAHGGIKGRPVQIIICDTKNDPATATACGREAVSDGVAAMVGNLTIYGSQFMPLMAHHKIASIGLEPITPADFTSPASFPISGGAPVNFAGLADALAESGAKKIVLARIDIPQAAALAHYVNAGLERFHLTMRDVPLPVGAPDMAPYAAAALENGTDGIVVTTGDQDAINFVLAVRQANPKVKIAMLATRNGDVIKALGTTAEGIMVATADTTALKNQAERRFEKDMAAAGYSNLTGYRLAAWASVQLFKSVSERLRTITAPAVFSALQQARNLSTGVTPLLQFKAGGVAGLPRVFNACVFMTRVKNGELVPISDKFENAFTGKPCPTPR